ncbi:MAG: primosomal protein N' [Candidatus Kapaibacterium sp.]|nr:MAG: primosomal protein N' [Candidatus Kapabacteria bacterium]
MSRFINVAVPLPMRKLFTYAVPADCAVQPGSRVIVPFGSKTYTGIVVEVDVSSRSDAKPIVELLDDAVPAITASLLELTRWMADYYLCSWGEALAAALPRELAPQSVVRARLLRFPPSEELSSMQRRAPKRAQLLELLAQHAEPVSVGFLQQQLQTESITAQLEALERSGYIELTSQLEGAHTPRTERFVALADVLRTNPGHLEHVLEELEHRAPKQARALSALAEAAAVSPIVSWHQARTICGVGENILRALLQKGYLQVHHVPSEMESVGTELSLAPSQRETDLPLTDEQAHAVSRINEALSVGRAKTFLLHGVTGSGKTLVYMHAITTVLAAGKTALVLVPEISLTPQLIDRFTAAFGTTVVAFHSRMSAGERYHAWRAIRDGRARVVLGPRSAVFAPLDQLGIIIVDEEHESSYKQESPAPRYHGRDAAIMRGHIEHAVVVLGSATPSLESMYNASTGKYHLLELATRADGAQLPIIRTLNLIEERKQQRITGRFSKTLLDAIIERLRRKEGVMLLHNRRGFAPRLECPECGHVPHCLQCSVALTYHKRTNQLRCHYCGRSYPVPQHCPSCGNPTLLALGAGTQRIEDELDTLLKQNGTSAVIARVDTDATTTKDSLRRILYDFSHGRIDIIVGTQMIAKGLDIGRVTLVGVINADMQLYIPDFRASERTFQLLTQVAGRAGRRADKPGEVIIQTAHPEHVAIKCARLYRYDLFYSDELQERRDANYPPFTRVALVEFSGTDLEQVDRHAQAFAHYLPRGVAAITTLGPSRPSLDRIKGKYRRIVLVKGDRQLDPNGTELRRALLSAWAAYNEHYASQAVRMTIDMDTQSSL